MLMNEVNEACVCVILITVNKKHASYEAHILLVKLLGNTNAYW